MSVCGIDKEAAMYCFNESYVYGRVQAAINQGCAIQNLAICSWKIQYTVCLSNGEQEVNIDYTIQKVMRQQPSACFQPFSLKGADMEVRIYQGEPKFSQMAITTLSKSNQRITYIDN